MKIVFFLIRFWLRILYLPFCLLPVQKKKIVFLSRQVNEPSIDFKYIADELLTRDEFKIVFLCQRLDNIKKHLFKYSIFTLKTIYHFATAKVCIVDSYSIISMLPKRKKTKVLQIWHALGAIKKFSYQTLDQPFGRSKAIAKGLKMHHGYDLILSSSEKTTTYFMEAFGYTKDSFYNVGMPRIDYLLENEQKNKKNIYKIYPEFKTKKTILYAPTFRKSKEDGVNTLLKNLDLKKYNIIVKSHANQKLTVKNGQVYTCPEFTALDLLAVSDAVITDYSAIALEAMVLKKKIYYYLYDYAKYQKNNGLNVDLMKELPKSCFKSAKQLSLALEKRYPWEEWEKYYEDYIEHPNGGCTKAIVDKIVVWSSDLNEKN